jgi:hypothetical protein
VRRLALDFRAVPLLERDELARPVEAAFERDAPPEARVERLGEAARLEFPLALALDPELRDELRLFCPLPEAVLAAISLFPLKSRTCVLARTGYPTQTRSKPWPWV